MIELNKKQLHFLFLISMEKNKCIRNLGRQIYSTDVSCYNVRDKLLSENLIYITNVKNREVPFLTRRGKKIINSLLTKDIK